jgi:mitochondrial chaperone BCS1
MTTNYPEKLDEALIRPGRVDRQVAFRNATQVQIEELFGRMYANDLPKTQLDISLSTTSTTAALSTSTKDVLTTPPTPSKSSSAPNGAVKVGEKEMLKGELTPKVLSEIAKAFAEQVPGDKFSPAEIQGFLLKRKKDPRKALEDVREWVEGMLEVKRTGTRLVNVQ